jgi:hypothetical protein
MSDKERIPNPVLQTDILEKYFLEEGLGEENGVRPIFTKKQAQRAVILRERGLIMLSERLPGHDFITAGREQRQQDALRLGVDLQKLTIIKK